MKGAWRLFLCGSLCLVFHNCDWGLLPVSEDGKQDLDMEVADQEARETDGAVDSDVDAVADQPEDVLPDDPDASDSDMSDPDAIETDTQDPEMSDPDLEEPEVPPDCGNGELDGEEECDNGDANSNTEPDACRLDCRRAHCGDGVTDSDEECDDGGANSDTEPDACRLDCTHPRCGDGVTDSDEECDDGVDNSNTEPDACRLDCRRAHCGDGVLDSGEDCDYDSAFCSGCGLAAPPGWTECTDTSGNPVFLYVILTPDNVTQSEMGSTCLGLIQSMSPRDFQFYGLAVIIDDNVWECIEAMLTDTQNYYIGLDQASIGAEPAGGWRWRAHDGTAEFTVTAYNDSNPYFEEYFDDLGGTGSVVDCGRLGWDGSLSQWYFLDYGCDYRTNWDGICMIQF